MYNQESIRVDPNLILSLVMKFCTGWYGHLFGSIPDTVTVYKISHDRYTGSSNGVQHVKDRYRGPVWFQTGCHNGLLNFHSPVYRSNRYAHSQNEFLCILTGMVTGMPAFFMMKAGIPVTVGNPDFPALSRNIHIPKHNSNTQNGH